MALKFVDSFGSQRYKNVALFLRVVSTGGDPLVLLFTEKCKQLGLPSGRMEKFDATTFDTLKREYREETGTNLPKLDNIQRYVWKNQIAIYSATTTDYIPLGRPHADGEVLDRKLLRVDVIRSGKFQIRKRHQDLIPALLDIISNPLSCWEQMIIFKLRTMHIPLNPNNINPDIDPKCVLCGYPRETVLHHLFGCPKLSDLRHLYLPPNADIFNTLYADVSQLQRTCQFYAGVLCRRDEALAAAELVDLDKIFE